MAVDDYLIDPDKQDWVKLLAGYRSLLPFEFSIWLVNRFGDLFLVDADDAVHRLDLASGTIAKVADNPEDFSRKIDEGTNAEDWLRPTLVDRLVAEGLFLGPGECYGLLVAPVLGGTFEVDNIEVRPIPRQYAAFAPNAGEGTSVVVDDTPMTIKVNYPPKRSTQGNAPGQEAPTIKVDYRTPR